MYKLKELFEQKIGGVVQEISPNDDMYQDSNKEHYFNVGHSALLCIKLAILASGKAFTDIKMILDMPCGYGRVLRMLKAAFPDAQITACDLNRDAVDFCARVFGVRKMYSEKRPINIQFSNKVDLIWCGSLFTHLNFDQWTEFLNFFNSVLEPGGILIFTTHGRFPADNIRSGRFTYGLEDPDRLKIQLKDFDRSGFGYSNYAHMDDYGISLSSPSYVLSQIEKQSYLQILTFTERGWDNHQDIIVCIKN